MATQPPYPYPPHDPIPCVMQPSEKLIEFIAQAEGFLATPKMDCGSLAIGYGHHGEEVKPGLVWTKLDAHTALLNDVEEVGRQVEHLVKVPLTQGQFNALVDFTYNLGSGRLAESSLLRLLNLKEYAAAGNEFVKWDMVNGEHNANLHARREAELSFWNGE